MKKISACSFLGLFLSVNALLSAEVDVVSIPGASLKRALKATVVLPRLHGKTDMRFPVLYMLHGYSQNHATWLRVLPLKQYADRYKLIFVCPDGAYDSWYLNNPRKRNADFETYIAVDVVNFIDSVYSTSKTPSGRALIGSSMGGHGALTILARHADRFAGAGSISGIMDLGEFPSEWGISKALGEFEKNREIWRNYSFIGLASKLGGRNKTILLDCGMSDFALPGNARAHELLKKEDIAHEYYIRPGGHTVDYVRHAAEFHILFFSRLLR